MPTETKRCSCALADPVANPATGGERIDYGYLTLAHTNGDIYVHFRNANVLAVGDVASPLRDPALDYLTGAWIGGRVSAMDRLLSLYEERRFVLLELTADVPELARAVHERDVPEAGRSVRQYRRQFWIPAAAGLLGGIAVVAFLFLARERILTFAESRLDNVEQQMSALETQVARATAAGDATEVARLSAQRPALEDERATRLERRNYAERIQATNAPIAILNAVLFMTAALLGYLKVRDSVTAADPQDPRLTDLRERRRELRALIVRDRERVRDADRDARAALAWAEFLSQSRPFEDWEGRRDRLGQARKQFQGLFFFNDLATFGQFTGRRAIQEWIAHGARMIRTLPTSVKAPLRRPAKVSSAPCRIMSATRMESRTTTRAIRAPAWQRPMSPVRASWCARRCNSSATPILRKTRSSTT